MATADQGPKEELHVSSRGSQRPPIAHTPEPWSVALATYYAISRPVGLYGATTVLEGRGNSAEEVAANIARAVKCVNACVKMEDPEKEVEELRETIQAQDAKIKNLEAGIEQKTAEIAGLQEAFRDAAQDPDGCILPWM